MEGSTQNHSGLGSSVCVVGAGILGLVATKNLLEQGLNVTAFTKDDSTGGLWHVSDDKEKTTAIYQTSTNTSKQANSITDFPMPDEFPTHPPAKDFNEYLNSYVTHFGLMRHIRFSELVLKVSRDEADQSWLVETSNVKTGKEEMHRFDRVVLATGILNVPHKIKVKGSEQFEGEMMHSREFKDPNKYKGKNVLVVGIGATGSDSLVFLKQAGANKLYLSHRGQYWVLPRMVEGRAFDHTMSYRAMSIVRFIASCSTRFCGFIMGKALMAAQTKAFPFMKDLPSFSPSRTPPSVTERLPFFSDILPYYLRDGDIKVVTGLEEVCGPRSVRLTDGQQLDDLDAIILCTGYHSDFSILQGKGDPNDSAYAPDGFKRIESAAFNTSKARLPRLYRGVLSEQYPESLAILGHFLMLGGVFAINDLASMALASMWSGSYPVPTREEMQDDLATHYDYVASTLERGPLIHWGFRLNSRETYAWFNQVAGTGMNERLGAWGWEGWKFWWTERKLYMLLMDGVSVPAVHRLFDIGRGRKPWSGARSHIEKVNEEVKNMAEKWKKEQALKPKQV